MDPKAEQRTTFDIVFIGAGVSTSYTVLNLLDNAMPRLTRIAIVEKSHGSPGGLPYSNRSGYTSLLITSLRHFLPDGERQLFIEWLNQNKHSALEPLRQHGGSLTTRWLKEHQAAIDANDWEDLYLPRYLFGVYMQQRVQARIDATPGCSIQWIEAAVTNISRAGDRFQIHLDSNKTLNAESVVLAAGSPPNQSKLAGIKGTQVIDDPYSPGLSEALDMAERTIRISESREVLLIGAAASTMDVLYTLNDRLSLMKDVRFKVLSPCGKLPDLLLQHPVNSPAFNPTHLKALAGKQELRAKEIYEAAARDIEHGGAIGLTTSDMLAPVSTAIDCLVARLSPSAKKEFAATWGNAIGRLQRRAGPEYSGVASQLASEGRLKIIRGKFLDISGAGVEYETPEGRVETLPVVPCVTFNCTGFAKVNALPDSHLFSRLITQGIVRPTPAATGFAVNDQMQACDGFFVMGPLLAGNVINGTPIWHLEHCGRISVFAKTLAAHLEHRLAARSVETAPMRE